MTDTPLTRWFDREDTPESFLQFLAERREQRHAEPDPWQDARDEAETDAMHEPHRPMGGSDVGPA